MNKTVNINIGGLFFHIDEDAYQKLSKYFEAIKRSLSNSSGEDEIMKDIEMRVAELFSERQKSDKHVINNIDVDEVISVMGQPEDYRISDDSDEPKIFNYYSTGKRKLFRDKERATFGGVCSGLGHYFGIESVWIKLLFLVLFFGFGSGFIVYLVLWIAMPKAVTTSEKLEMRGEPVTISNIEKKVREEFENVSEKVREEFEHVSDKIKNANHELGKNMKSRSESFGSRLGDVFTTIFNAFAKVIGAFIVVFSSLSLLGTLVIFMVLIFSSTLPQITLINYFRTPLGLETPLWIQGILFLLTLGIPLFFLLILGLKLVVTNYKSIGNIAKYTLLAVWIIAIGILAVVGINKFTQIASEGKEIKKEVINILPKDTLNVSFENNIYYDKEISNHTDYRLTLDETNQEVIYSNNVSIKVMKTDEAIPYIQIEKLAYGNSALKAKLIAQKIKYNFKIQGNKLILDNYFLSEVASKFRNQKVEIFLYLPKETLLKLDKTVQDFDTSDNELFNINYNSGNYIYQMGEKQIKCLNCPQNNNVDSDEPTNNIIIDANDSSKTVSVKVNGKGINIKTK
jgi:phage shock protein PspC (stress-responsive transcriptional regulator)